MKMTMQIDEVLLARVMEAYGCESKTEAVEMALQEMDRRARLKAYLAEGNPFSEEELKNSVDPDYDILGIRKAEAMALYGKARYDSGR